MALRLLATFHSYLDVSRACTNLTKSVTVTTNICACDVIVAVVTVVAVAAVAVVIVTSPVERWQPDDGRTEQAEKGILLICQKVASYP